MMILIPLTVAALCIMLDIRRLLRSKRREIYTWVIAWVLGLAAVIGVTYNLVLPSPLEVIIAIYRPINRLFFFWL